jgi:hypothetical protein
LRWQEGNNEICVIASRALGETWQSSLSPKLETAWIATLG